MSGELQHNRRSHSNATKAATHFPDLALGFPSIFRRFLFSCRIGQGLHATAVGMLCEAGPFAFLKETQSENTGGICTFRITV
jgi:hypothetical protein